MRELLFGQERGVLGVGRSYVIFTEVPGESLAVCCRDFLAAHAADEEAIGRLTSRLAALVRGLHQAGFVHRDLYTTHLFLDRREGRTDLYLVDLARLFAPRWRTFRWRAKDLAQLKFSMPREWVAAQWDSFLRQYLEGAPPSEFSHLDRAVQRKAERILRRLRRKQRPQ